MAMNVKSIKNWVKEKWNNSVNWILKIQVKSLVIGVLLFLIVLLVANLSGDRCWPPIPFIENLGKTETSKFCNPGVLIVRLGYAIGGVIALLFIEVYFGIKVFINWVKEKWNNSVNCVKENPKPIVIVILLLLVGILLYNLSPGTTCWPGKLGIPETSQSCKNIKCCHSGTLILRLGYAIGGMIALLVAVASFERARALDKTAEAQEQGNVEERYKNAISQLGKENSSVRLAGAYGLYYLARDNEDRRENICDVLCVHIRGLTTSKALIFNGESYSNAYKDKPSDEVQSILDILVNKDNEKDFLFKSHWINLENTYLNGVNLSSAQLQGADLRRVKFENAQLQGADLKDVQLQGANLSKSQFQEAVLSSAQLQGADLKYVQLQGADLIEAQLQGADLSGAYLQEANLSSAQLQGANLDKAQLQGANLEIAQLQGSDLVGVELQGANLSSAQLQGANLRVAQLQGTDLHMAEFQGANLEKANFSGAFTEKDISIDSAIRRLEARKNQRDDIKNATFSGGVTTERLKNFKTNRAIIEKTLIDINYNDISRFKDKMDGVEEILKNNIGKRGNKHIPSKAITGRKYPEAEADKVIEMLEGIKKITETNK